LASAVRRNNGRTVNWTGADELASSRRPLSPKQDGLPDPTRAKFVQVPKNAIPKRKPEAIQQPIPRFSQTQIHFTSRNQPSYAYSHEQPKPAGHVDSRKELRDQNILEQAQIAHDQRQKDKQSKKLFLSPEDLKLYGQ